MLHRQRVLDILLQTRLHVGRLPLRQLIQPRLYLLPSRRHQVLVLTSVVVLAAIKEKF